MFVNVRIIMEYSGRTCCPCFQDSVNREAVIRSPDLIQSTVGIILRTQDESLMHDYPY